MDLVETGTTLFTIAIVIIGLLIFGPALLASLEERDIASKTKFDFCPEGKTTIGSGFASSRSFCKGREFTCTTNECYWITDSQEKVKDK